MVGLIGCRTQIGESVDERVARFGRKEEIFGSLTEDVQKSTIRIEVYGMTDFLLGVSEDRVDGRVRRGGGGGGGGLEEEDAEKQEDEGGDEEEFYSARREGKSKRRRGGDGNGP